MMYGERRYENSWTNLCSKACEAETDLWGMKNEGVK